MKPLFSSFAFFDREHGPITVDFRHDERGKPLEVVAQMLGRTFTLDNAGGKYKPCVTHCGDVVRHFLAVKPKSNQERKRRRKTTPKLTLIGD